VSRETYEFAPEADRLVGSNLISTRVCGGLRASERRQELLQDEVLGSLCWTNV